MVDGEGRAAASQQACRPHGQQSVCPVFGQRRRLWPWKAALLIQGPSTHGLLQNMSSSGFIAEGDAVAVNTLERILFNSRRGRCRVEKNCSCSCVTLDAELFKAVVGKVLKAEMSKTPLSWRRFALRGTRPAAGTLERGQLRRELFADAWTIQPKRPPYRALATHAAVVALGFVKRRRMARCASPCRNRAEHGPMRRSQRQAAQPRSRGRAVHEGTMLPIDIN